MSRRRMPMDRPMSAASRHAKLRGVYLAEVVQNSDGGADKRYQVELSFPWLPDEGKSHWGRVAVPMAGNGRGCYFLPEAGDQVLQQMKLPVADEPRDRQSVIDALVAQHKKYRDEMFARTREATDSLEKMTTYFATCVNCYNCRVACPVCYCKECVFVTDVFNHDPSQYLRWANRKGIIKMPTDTLFYHLTRLTHMSTACVGCGQCSNACPNGIPVMELFRTIAHGTQRAFEYEAGRSIDQEPPLATFREDEFDEVVGISN